MIVFNSTSDQKHSLLDEKPGSLETPLHRVTALEHGTTLLSWLKFITQ